ncbi:MAG: RNA polymerase sigma-70 factor [Bacteroidales bacterium]|nr:RNA polymerase sigma-70 factor [Bacteroidales bacterium]
MMLNKIDDISDNLLVTRIRQNDKNAFKILYNRYSRKIYFFSLKFLGNNFETEELVQSVFINVWETRESLDTAGSVKSYIYRSAVNYIINYLKRKSVRTRFMELQIHKEDFESNNTYEQVFFNDLEKTINSVVGALPPGQQKIFRLSRFEGLTHKEIAGKLDLSVRTVENQMYRALKTIKTILKERYFLY